VKEECPNTPESSNTIKAMSDEDLVRWRAALEVEMRHRGLGFSVGEIGETLVIGFFNATPGLPNLLRAPAGTKNVDALSRNGDRYSIKAVWKARKTSTIYPDDQDREKQLFEFLLIAQLNDDLTLKSIHEFSWRQFVDIRSWDKRMSAWYVGYARKTLSQARLIIAETISVQAEEPGPRGMTCEP
jgi:hypothetical protein